MGQTRDLFKKIRDTKGIFHAKMGTIKDRNGMDLTEAEDIKKGWQEYTEKQYKLIEESNRMEKTSDLVKKIRDTMGIFHAKMGTIKDRNNKGQKQ